MNLYNWKDLRQLKFVAWLHFLFPKISQMFFPSPYFLPFFYYIICFLFFSLDKTLLIQCADIQRKAHAFSGSCWSSRDTQHRSAVIGAVVELQMLLSQAQNRPWREVKNAVISRSEGEVVAAASPVQVSSPQPARLGLTQCILHWFSSPWFIANERLLDNSNYQRIPCLSSNSRFQLQIGADCWESLYLLSVPCICSRFLSIPGPRVPIKSWG